MNSDKLIVKIVKTEKGNIDLVNANGNTFKNVPPAAILAVVQNQKLIQIRQQNDASFYVDPQKLEATQILPAAEVPFDPTASSIYDLLILLRTDFFFELAGGGGSGDNIYNADGTLTGLRQLSYGGNDLIFGDLLGDNDEPAIYFDVNNTLGSGKGFILKAGNLTGAAGFLTFSHDGVNALFNYNSTDGNTINANAAGVALSTSSGGESANLVVLKTGSISLGGTKPLLVSTAGIVENRITDVAGAAYNVLLSDFAIVAQANTTLTLPLNPEIGTVFEIYANNFNITIAAQGANLINGAASIPVTGYAAAKFKYVGVNNWLTL